MEIALYTYLFLSSTIGAYCFAIFRSREDEDVTLMDVLGSIFPAVAFGWFLLLALLCSSIVIKKRSR
jgi:hypothetical protein